MRCLSIAGLDPSGNAGLLVDQLAIESAGAKPLLVPAGLTAQSSTGPKAVFPVPPDFLLRQLDVLLEDGRISAVKTGALFSRENIRVIVRFLRGNLAPLVVDPIIRASSGFPLLEPGALDLLLDELFPLALLLTPNIDETEELTGLRPRDPEEMATAAEMISSMGPNAVLIKGGHLEEPLDLLWFNREVRIFPHTRRAERRGTGCALSAAIAGRLALGYPLPEAVAWGVDWVQMSYLAL